jgi:hypothetical protein
MHCFHRLPAFFLISAVLLMCGVGSAQQRNKVLAWRGERPVRARHAIVVSVRHLASDAGVEIG